MRKRINPMAICSSENYVASKRVHRQFINSEHSRNKSMLESINQSIPKVAYTKVFGKEYRLTPQEIKNNPHLNIYYK